MINRNRLTRLAVTAVVAAAIHAAPATAQTWSKTYWWATPPQGVPAPNEILEMSDGSLVVAGQVFIGGMLVMFDPFGNMEWSQRLPASVAGGFWDAVETIDGGIAVTGELRQAGASTSNIPLIKYGASGAIEWYREYGGDDRSESARALAQAVDGSLFIAGFTNANGPDRAFLWLVKTDAEGNLLWQKSYGGADDELMETSSLALLPGGGIVLAGSTASWGPSSGQSLWILFLDDDGAILSQQVLGGASGGDWANDIVVTEDGRLIVVGRTDSYGPIGLPSPVAVWLLAFNSSGTLLWQKAYGTTAESIYPNHVAELSNGDLVVSGSGSRPVVLRTTSTGTLQWAKKYDDGNGTSSGRALELTDSGHLVLGSFVNSYLGTWLLRTDDAGEVSEWCDVVSDLALTEVDTTAVVTDTDAVAAVTSHLAADITPSPSDVVYATDDTCIPEAPRIEVQPWWFNFGVVEVGMSDMRSFVIRNTGDLDLTVSDMAVALPFTVPISCASAVVAPLASCNAELEFAPSAHGPVTEELTVSSDDPVTPSLSIKLEGEGFDPEIFSDGFESGDSSAWS